jgi:predicted  nucleic acid-binding Zn-ribbon protein
MAQDQRNDDPVSAIGAALHRLDQAMATLEERLVRRLEAALGHEDEILQNDRNRLSSELAAARSREKALEDVAAEASAALGRAAAEVRAALASERR